VETDATSRRPGGRPLPFRSLFVEPRRLRSIRERPSAHWYAVGAVCIGAFMGQLDASIVTLAFPSLEHAFHAAIGVVTWVGLSYLVTLVALVTVVGRFADMAGRKLLYIYGFVVFAVGSAACGLAPNLTALDCFRVIQGAGAAMLQANSLAIINLAVPRGAFARAFGVQGAAQALGLALGPSVGGALIVAGGWRLIFLVNVPVGLIGVVAGWLFIPRSARLRTRVGLDWAGLGFFVPAVATLLVAVSVGKRWGWGSTGVLALFAVAVAAGLGFVARESRARHPMLDLGLFGRRTFGFGVASALLAYLVTFGVLLVAPYLFERALAVGPGGAGLDLMVMPLALGAVALVAGHFAERLGLRVMTTFGLVLVAATLGALTFSTPNTARLVAALAVIGVGFGLFTPANSAAIMSAVPREQSGEASGVVNVTRGVGTALGLALTGLVFSLGGGDGARVPDVVAGYHDAAAFLAVVALVAAAIAGSRSRQTGPARVGEEVGTQSG
jgi:EmrB/QacA subfamily drug resistance transporter